MSHFTVAVITKPGQNYEDLLAPFSENIDVEPYVRSTKAELIKGVKDFIVSLKKDMEDYKKDPKEFLERKNTYWLEKNNIVSSSCQERLDLENKSDDEVYRYIREHSGYDDDCYDENGNELSTYNPNSKWDWYSLGGRWGGSLLTKDGKHVDMCDLKNLDVSDNMEDYKNAERFWEVVIEKAPLIKGENEEDFHTWYKDEFYTERYKTKENYAKCQSKFTTFAVLTPDGEWHEPGTMGWFGCSSETDEDHVNWILHYKENFIDPYIDDCEIYLVDCHI